MNDSKITPPAPSCFGSFPFLSFQQQAEYCCNDCFSLTSCKTHTPQAPKDSEPKTPNCFGNYSKKPGNGCDTYCLVSDNCRNSVILHQVTNQGQVGGDHYRNAEITPWDVWDTWPLEQRIGAYRSNAVKYLMRMGTKDDRLQEAKKCLHYVQKLVEVLENG